MKRLLTASLLIFASLTLSAQSDIEPQGTRYFTGIGTYSAYCTDTDYFCVDNVKRTARRYAEDDGAWQCRIQNGKVDYIAPSCWDMCNPNYIPPGSGSTFVSCRSDCQVRCDLPDKLNTEETE